MNDITVLPADIAEMSVSQLAALSPEVKREVDKNLDTAIPTVTQCGRQRVAVAPPLVQHVGELGFDHPQPFVLDGGHVLATLSIAVVDQRSQSFARGQAAAMNLRREGFVHRSQCLIDPQYQRHRIALAATAGTPDVQAEQPRVMPGIADGQIHATPDGA